MWSVCSLPKMHKLSETAADSPHLPPKCSLTAPFDLKMGLLGSFGCPFWPPKCDSRPLLRTHYLLCFHCKMNILRRLWTLWERSLQHCPHLAPSGTNFLPLQSLPGSIWRLKWVAWRTPICHKRVLGISRNRCRQHFGPPWCLKVLSRVPTDP